MTYATPTFTNGSILSARQIEELSAGMDDVYERAVAIMTPQPVLGGNDTHSPVGTLIYDADIIHRHINATWETAEALNYDIGANGADAVVRVFYGATELTSPTAKPNNAEAIDSFTTPAGAATRKRNTVTLNGYSPPALGHHPVDGDLVHVQVWVYQAAQTVTVTVYELQETWIGLDGYTSMNDATALRNPDAASVATDLQHVATNVAALDTLCWPAIAGFRCAQKTAVHNSHGEVDVGIWGYYSLKSNNLYYRIGFYKEPYYKGGDRTVTAKVYATAGASTVSKTETFVKDAGGNPTYGLGMPYIVEGYLDLSGLTRNVQQRIRVRVTVAYDGDDYPNPNQDQGEGGLVVYYLGEGPGVVAGSSGYTETTIHAAHGDYVLGDSGSGFLLRDLWANALALAGDSGTGYGTSGYSVANGYPVGYAVASFRNDAMHRGTITTDATIVRGKWGLISGKDVLYQMMAFRRSHNYLYYRCYGGELVYTGPDGLECIVGLENFDDDVTHTQTYARYHVYDLVALNGLEIGQWYYVRVRIDVSTDWEHQNDPRPEVLDFAQERYA